jgi:hypothetical protein
MATDTWLAAQFTTIKIQALAFVQKITENLCFIALQDVLPKRFGGRSDLRTNTAAIMDRVR